MIKGRGLHRLRSDKPTRKKEDTKELSCGTCAFFGKPIFCLRREKYAKAIPCASYERKISLQDETTSPMFPLLPDSGARKPEEETARPSSAWYLVPFFFGILGGIVAYVAVKDRDDDMASGLLFFGIFWTVIAIILYFAAFSMFLNALF